MSFSFGGTAFGSLMVVEPPSEPVSVDMLRSHLRLDVDENSALLKIYISAARTWIEDVLGRSLAAQQFLFTIGTEPPTGAYPYVALPFPVAIYPLWYPWPTIVQRAFDLPRAPVISVDKVTYGIYGQADTTIDPTLYELDAGTARLRINPGTVPPTNNHVGITFTAGYPAGGIPANNLLAVMMLASFIYENRGDSGGELPAAVLRLLTNRRITFGG